MSSASRLAACLVTPSSSASRETVGCSAATARITNPNDGRIDSPPDRRDRRPEPIGHAAVGGDEQDREVGLAHTVHGGANTSPSSIGPPAGAHAATARNGSSARRGRRTRRRAAGPGSRPGRRVLDAVDDRDGGAALAEEQLLAVHVMRGARAAGRELDRPQADLRGAARRRGVGGEGRARGCRRPGASSWVMRVTGRMISQCVLTVNTRLTICEG